MRSAKRHRPTLIVMLAFLAATTVLPAFAQEDNEDIVIGHYRIIHSAILDEDRTLLVNLPRGYEATAIRYPVIYILYGGQIRNYFPEALHITTLMSTTRMPPVILVGVVNTDRYRDYLPLDREGNPAGADRFLRFMVEEAMPFVEANYRAADFRILVGPQAGGTFGLYTLTQRPETFDVYILNNPFRYLQQRDYLIERVRTVLAERDTLDNFLYVIAEDSDFPEALEYMPRLEEALSAKRPAQFAWKLDVVEENGDFLAPTGLREGLTLVFSGYGFPAATEVASLAEIQRYYAGLSQHYGYEVAIPDMVLAMGSDNLAQAGRVGEAIELLERLVALYPASLNGWWRLGGIYRERGDIERALAYYRKCLEVDPDMVYAQRMIEELERERSIDQVSLAIPFGPRATIDGEVSPGEWDAARLVRFSFEDVLGDSVIANVWLMHDDQSLQVAYVFEPTNEEIFIAPELFLDTDNDRSPSLRSDDWWFHVSASDCATAGRYDDYSTCTMNADWETGPRPSQREHGEQLDTFEIRIPFSKIRVATGSEIGLGFRVMHSAQVSGEWVMRTAFWPLHGSPDSPATWETAQLLPDA